MSSTLQSPPHPVTPALYRAAFRLHPEGITIVTTLDEFGNLWGMTATAVAAVSLDPPLILVCVDNRSGLLGPMCAGAPFIVHFLGGDQGELATRFATPLEDKFSGLTYCYTSSGCAKLSGAAALLECVAHGIHPAGDHTICVGRVLDVTINERVDGALGFFDGRIVTLPRNP